MAGEKEKKVNEANSEPGSSKKGPTVKALKPKPKIVKKPPNTNVSQTIKNKGTPSVQRKRIKKKKKHFPEGDEKQNNSSEMKQKDQKKNENEKQKQTIKTGENLGFRKKQKDQKKNEKGGASGYPRSQMGNGKRPDLEKNQHREKKKENIDGLIFMCNAKTKPDCFRYGVMGVSIGKKDVVLGIKPGLKLFLYDFDLRLMYGIYQASSSGGEKLEPTAFGGAFPFQVRFTVHEDCYPVPENVFKKAIIENYDRNKFSVELNAKQVKKLTELFRPVNVGSKLPAATIQNMPPVLPRENGPSTEKDEFPRDSFLTEKEYRTYGLRAEKRPNPPTLSESRIVPIEYPTRPTEEYHLRNPPAIYRDMAPPLGPRQELTYSIPSVDLYPYPRYPYSAPPRRDEIYSSLRESYPVKTDYLPRGEIYSSTQSSNYLSRGGAEGLYSIHASSALSDYNRTSRPEPSATESVSARYSFAGPSVSYR